jgi:large subunit ribosomal protein L21
LYSIIEIGGLQQKVEPGDRIRIPYRKAETGTKITIDRILLVNNGKDVKVGNPTVSGSSVVAQVLNQGKDKKITIFKKKRRKRYQKKVGHRQTYTEIEILEVDGQKAKPKKPAKKAAKAKESPSKAEKTEKAEKAGKTEKTEKPKKKAPKQAAKK